MVVLSDVWLDRPEALAKLQAIFAGYAALDRPPSLFVLLGSFQVAMKELKAAGRSC